jgi:hypothetical protein
LANNKTLTRDNLAKRRFVEDESCLFCDDKESIKHLFFECCVAKCIWQICSEMSEKQLGADFESVVKWWLHNKNLTCLLLLFFWTIWKFRNEMCFKGKSGRV